jgi:hypothetical protein
MNVIAAVFDEFERALAHPEAGEPHVDQRLVSPAAAVAPGPGWTRRQLRRSPHLRRKIRGIPLN